MYLARPSAVSSLDPSAICSASSSSRTAESSARSTPSVSSDRSVPVTTRAWVAGSLFGPSRQRRRGPHATRHGPARIERRRAISTPSPAAIPRCGCPWWGRRRPRSMTVCDHRSTSAISRVRYLRNRRRQPHVRAGSPIDSSSAICSDASRDASRRGLHHVIHHQAGHAHSQRRLVACERCTTPAAPKSGWRCAASTLQPVPQSIVRGAIRIAMVRGRRRVTRRRVGGPVPN